MKVGRPHDDGTAAPRTALWLVFLAPAFFACGTTTTGGSRVDTQWTLTTLTSKCVKTPTNDCADGATTRAEVSGYFIFRSDGTFVEDITLARVPIVQAATYSVTGTTLSLVGGDLTLTYTFAVSADGQTMTWDAQDDAQDHWVFTLQGSTTEPI